MCVCVCVVAWLTTLTSCEIETSNSTVTGSETFSTGLMNWLYLLNSFLNSRSSALDDKQSGQMETETKRGGDRKSGQAVDELNKKKFSILFIFYIICP